MKIKLGTPAKVKTGLQFVYLTPFVDKIATVIEQGRWEDGVPYTKLRYSDGTEIKWKTEYIERIK